MSGIYQVGKCKRKERFHVIARKTQRAGHLTVVWPKTFNFQVDFHFDSKQAFSNWYFITILSRLIRVTFPKIGETKWQLRRPVIL